MLTETLKLEIGVISVVHIFSIILAIIFFMTFYMKANRDYAMRAFLITQLSMILWMVFKIFKTVSPTVVSRWWFIVGYYFCACVLEIAFLEFGYAYYKGKAIPLKIRYGLYVLPILQFIMVLTNEYHHLFYATYHFFGDTFGPGFYVHTAIEYCYIAVGFVYCYKMFKVRFRNKPIWYRYFISSAIIVPLILNFLFITKVIHRIVSAIGIPVVFDVTPIVFTWSVMVFVHGTFNADFLNLPPLLRHEIVHKLDTPVGILDSAFSVIYVNDKLNVLAKGDGKGFVTRLTKQIELMNHEGEVTFEEYCITLQVTTIKTFTETQYILILKDISDYKTIRMEIGSNQKELITANAELEGAIDLLKETSKIGARNYIARELHDIIGHSLVVTIKLIEVAKLYLFKDYSQSEAALIDASSALDNGIKTMEEVADGSQETGNYNGEHLKKELTQMLKLVNTTDVKTHLNIKGQQESIDEMAYDTLKKVCTELVTNTLKHSGAKELFISVTIKIDELAMMVLDNGVGTDDLEKGNGLRGIEARLGLIGGSIEFVSAYNEGFMSKIRI